MIYAEIPLKEVKPLTEQAIECLQIICKKYKLKMSINYVSKIGTYSANCGWTIKIMDKKFMSVDFVKAASSAVEFVYEAHEKIIINQ